MITALVVLVVLVLALTASFRYGRDSRSGGDPTGRDPAWPHAPARAHTPADDARRVLAAWSRRLAAHRRAWEAYDRSRRVWEGEATR